jgi:hypothetical protein
MIRRMSRVRLVPWGLVLVLVTMPSAMCVLGATMTQPEADCVMPMDEDSGAALRQGCCAAERLDLISLASIVPADPSPSLTAVVVSLAESASPRRFAAAFESSPFGTSSRPTYLLVSAFRI